MKVKIGFFGAALDIVVVAGMLHFSAIARGFAGFTDYLPALPLLAFSAFVVSSFVVSSRAARRAGREQTLFIDSPILVMLGVVSCSVWIALLNMHGQDLRAVPRISPRASG